MAEMSHPEALAEESSQANTAQKRTEPVYELGFHLVPTLSEEAIGPALEAARRALGDVEVIKESFPQKMTLAYQVERAGQGKREKYTSAYFGSIKFALKPEADRAQVAALQEKLRGMKEVLRYLVVETVREDVAQSRQRTVFVSDRLEGKTLEKPAAQKETPAQVNEAELDKSIEALTG